jgi:hypothetical protein
LSSLCCRRMKSENDLVKASSFKECETDGGICHRRQGSGSSIHSDGYPKTSICGHIIRVSMQCDDKCNLYKSIWVSRVYYLSLETVDDCDRYSSLAAWNKLSSLSIQC